MSTEPTTATPEVKPRKSNPKPFLTKRKRSKNWYVVTTDPKTGKRSFKSTGEEDENKAKIILREIETNLGITSQSRSNQEHVKQLIIDSVERTSGVIIQHKTPLEEIWKEYTRNERVRALRQSTLRGNKNILALFIKFLQEIGIEYIEQVSYETCRLYLDRMRSDKKADGTIINHRHCLHGIFKKVKRPLGLLENPFEDIETPFKPKRRKHRCFTRGELKAVLEVVPDDWRAIITLSFYTGLRFGDCCTFKMDCIDWDTDLITLSPSKTERYNKEIIIPIHPILKSTLQGYSKALTGYLVPHFAKLYLERDVLFSKHFGRLLHSLEISKETSEGVLDFHSLRHTFNTNLANSGVDTSTRMKLTGHSSIEVNQIYNHATEPLRGAISCLPGIV